LKAIQKVRASRVTIEKRDPNSVRAREQPDTERERVEKRLNEHLNTGGATDDAPASKRARLGEVDLKSKEFQQMLNRKSAHQDTVDEAEVEQRDKYFDLLEKKETLEEKMAATMSTKCVAYTCKKCQRRPLYNAVGICKTSAIQITRPTTPMQKFFQCKACASSGMSDHRQDTAPPASDSTSSPAVYGRLSRLWAPPCRFLWKEILRSFPPAPR
ncbi:PREDICTED: protein MCM10 homolog, partial [Priapulus caudatus]|uniref:Protein MCM10 homolog n=1 Tax=Priapulus caudatus TaxID=37621 RepID=A0ABM1F251_PRICU